MVCALANCDRSSAPGRWSPVRRNTYRAAIARGLIRPAKFARQFRKKHAPGYADRLIASDADICEAWGRLTARRPLPVIDGLLAAAALARGLTLVTRNVRDFADVGFGVLNPWEA